MTAQSPDLISELLRGMRLSGVKYRRIEASAPFGVAFHQAPGTAQFHFVSRGPLLQEVWGYDYYGGTRTVDVHVRRLRAKLGPDHEALIGTVRNVGYRFVLPPKGETAQPAEVS